MLVAKSQGRCTLWVRDKEEALNIAARRENVRFLPGVSLPNTLHIEYEPAAALSGASLVIMAIPMQHLETNWEVVGNVINPAATILSGIKGLNPVSGERVSEAVARLTDPTITNRLAVLSGPNLAREIASGEPATAVIAAAQASLAQAIQARLRTPEFRTYASDDVIGVELAGALKNVIAIGAGMADGLRFGNNAKSALMTRGLAEITRLGVAAGANVLTFGGLAGMGDLIATCASSHSRNHYVGHQLAEGRSLNEIQSRMVMVAEGVNTSRGALILARNLNVEMPIVELINQTLFHKLPVAEAGQILMDRELSHELRGVQPV